MSYPRRPTFIRVTSTHNFARPVKTINVIIVLKICLILLSQLYQKCDLCKTNTCLIGQAFATGSHFPVLIFTAYYCKTKICMFKLKNIYCMFQLHMFNIQFNMCQNSSHLFYQ